MGNVLMMKNKVDKDSKEFNVLHELKVSKDKIKGLKDSTAPFISCSLILSVCLMNFPNLKRILNNFLLIFMKYFRQSINGNPIDFKKKY